ncbi:MvaI/BcnI family restriction endonuclease [Geobacillus sp. C56-T2]|uniref:MvaI/BcnI family restriction endonuclease n=1 Tax=Geobacillus sp. C56-T2 TaxID=600773 RepID=UPI0011ACF4F1|nr:MvaI/BcnI family restriction endonuclease [Geobacillus sp. C56-T2]TWG29512.1 MvaI/BcnI restriction endonuclease family protein [Geobacillus sp. C56-T2]
MSNDFNTALESFKKDFLKIKGKEFPSNRKHDTGIGKTFEDLIGVEENNNLLVDYKGHIELKSQRQFTGSMLTLFTKQPEPKGIVNKLKDLYGTPHEKYSQYNILHTTVNAVDFNTYKSKYGFKMEVDREAQKIRFLVKDLQTGKIVNNEGYFDFSVLKEIVETKCKNIAYINAKNRKHGDQEYFIFDKALLLSGLTFDKFINLVENGTIKFDFRVGVYGSGKNLGKPHDHGSAFRIPKNAIGLAFNIETI